jgi:hypothetical protein
MNVAGYFQEIATAAEDWMREVGEVHRKDAAAKEIGLSWAECCRAFGDEYLAVENAHKERCAIAAQKYGVASFIVETVQ